MILGCARKRAVDLEQSLHKLSGGGWKYQKESMLEGRSYWQ